VVPFVVATLGALACAAAALIFVRQRLIEAAREDTRGYF
jgi:hypothetical protein